MRLDMELPILGGSRAILEFFLAVQKVLGDPLTLLCWETLAFILPHESGGQK